MILELADIRIQPGRQSDFDAAIVRGVDTVISRARGFRGYKVNKGVESPERYLLMIFWDTLENHTVDFRGSPAFAEFARSSARSSPSRRRSSTSRCWRSRPRPDPPRRSPSSGRRVARMRRLMRKAR
jgi:heme-degrading monooxygenase HmoA